ncbi:MAG: Vps62-related protein [Oligoflexia bacterium]|nr:Vps62-related protein [Oligoflexia bacterium]
MNIFSKKYFPKFQSQSISHILRFILNVIIICNFAIYSIHYNVAWAEESANGSTCNYKDEYSEKVNLNDGIKQDIINLIINLISDPNAFSKDENNKTLSKFLEDIIGTTVSVEDLKQIQSGQIPDSAKQYLTSTLDKTVTAIDSALDVAIPTIKDFKSGTMNSAITAVNTILLFFYIGFAKAWVLVMYWAGTGNGVSFGGVAAKFGMASLIVGIILCLTGELVAILKYLKLAMRLKDKLIGTDSDIGAIKRLTNKIDELTELKNDSQKAFEDSKKDDNPPPSEGTPNAQEIISDNILRAGQIINTQEFSPAFYLQLVRQFLADSIDIENVRYPMHLTALALISQALVLFLIDLKTNPIKPTPMEWIYLSITIGITSYIISLLGTRPWKTAPMDDALGKYCLILFKLNVPLEQKQSQNFKSGMLRRAVYTNGTPTSSINTSEFGEVLSDLGTVDPQMLFGLVHFEETRIQMLKDRKGQIEGLLDRLAEYSAPATNNGGTPTVNSLGQLGVITGIDSLIKKINNKISSLPQQKIDEFKDIISKLSNINETSILKHATPVPIQVGRPPCYLNGVDGSTYDLNAEHDAVLGQTTNTVDVNNFLNTNNSNKAQLSTSSSPGTLSSGTGTGNTSTAAPTSSSKSSSSPSSTVRNTSQTAHLALDLNDPTKSDTEKQRIRERVANRMELLLKYAPIVFLHSKDRYGPSSAEFYLNGVSIVNNSDTTIGNQAANVLINATRPYTGEDAITNKNIAFLKIGTSGTFNRIRYGNFNSAKCYAKVVENPEDKEGYIDLIYFFFYPFNGSPTVPASKFLGNTTNAIVRGETIEQHEGDWEHITVRLRPGNNPTIDKIYYAAHGTIESNQFTNEKTDKASTDGYQVMGSGNYSADDSANSKRIVVYSANETHASYSSVGTHRRKTNFPQLTQYPFFTSNSKLIGLPEDETDDKGRQLDCKKKIEMFIGDDIEKYPYWMKNHKGRWGFPFGASSAKGPDSPWNDNFVSDRSNKGLWYYGEIMQ